MQALQSKVYFAVSAAHPVREVQISVLANHPQAQEKGRTMTHLFSLAYALLLQHAHSIHIILYRWGF
jgi:hypothetical protein